MWTGSHQGVTTKLVGISKKSQGAQLTGVDPLCPYLFLLAIAGHEIRDGVQLPSQAMKFLENARPSSIFGGAN